ncbi:unnamed protein product [Amaranthus hypochondriacus]
MSSSSSPSNSSSPQPQRRTKRPRQAVNRPEEFEGLIFGSRVQQVRFNELKVRKTPATRFIDHDCLRFLGIFHESRDLFSRLGLSSLFTMFHNSYKKLTLEFLSSLDLVDEEDAEDSVILQFRLLNNDYSLTESQLAGILGVENDGNLDLNQDMEAAPLFRAISGARARNVREMVTSGVHHPSIRICLRLLADTFCHKAEANKVATLDMYILARALRSRDLPFPINLTKAIVNSFREITAQNGFGQINIGGIVTHIAIAVAGFVEPEVSALRRRDCLINIPHLDRKKWVTDLTTHVDWHIRDFPDIPLPASRLPPLTDHARHYLFRRNALPILAAPQQHPIPHYPPPAPSPQHQPSPPHQHEYHAQPSPPPFSIESAFNALTLNINERFDALERRFEAEHEENSRALQPMYADYYARGCIPAGTIHPTWFTAPTPPPVYNYTRQGFFDASAPDGSTMYYPSEYYQGAGTSREFGEGSEVVDHTARRCWDHYSPDIYLDEDSE